ncbi:MAG: septum formation initiator family protein [Bacteroidales bacterium]|nr:septum formation initiator family protein [Bacteroidales bacterium]
MKNKYFVAFFVFLLVIFFLDENNLFVVRSLHHEVAELKYTVDTMQEGIYRDSLQAERLKYDLDSIERFGRENYFMKAENEDVFVVTRVER